jgi:Flp pilus assembly pilin Flp
VALVTTPIRELFVRFWSDEAGQDLIEYALLTATIGLAGATVWSVMDTAISSTYTSNVDGANEQWESPAPSAP